MADQSEFNHHKLALIARHKPDTRYSLETALTRSLDTKRSNETSCDRPVDYFAQSVYYSSINDFHSHLSLSLSPRKQLMCNINFTQTNNLKAGHKLQ